MEQLLTKNKKILFSSLAAFIILSSTLLTADSAKTIGAQITLGLWHFDVNQASGDSVVTLDSVSFNNGILGGPAEPALVDGKFDKALSFNGSNFVYVPISFLVGFPPTPQPIYIPISPGLNAQNQIKLMPGLTLRISQMQHTTISL